MFVCPNLSDSRLTSQSLKADGRCIFALQVVAVAPRGARRSISRAGVIASMEWRAVTVTGEYDFENQMALRNQYSEGIYGFHLITPLQFDGGVVLVNRGWIPAESDSLPDDWRMYDETGIVTVTGQIRLGQGKPSFGGVADALPADGIPLWVWNNLDVTMMSPQMPYPILPIFIQPTTQGDSEPPIPYQPIIELTEGSHFGYALQWFTFAVILFFGYPFYLRKQDD